MTAPLLQAGSTVAWLVHRILTGHTLSVLPDVPDRLAIVCEAVAHLKAVQPVADVMFLADDAAGRDRLIAELAPRMGLFGIEVEAQWTSRLPGHTAVRVWAPESGGGSLHANVAVLDPQTVGVAHSRTLAWIDSCQQLVVTSVEPSDLTHACRFTQQINHIREIDWEWAGRLWGEVPVEVMLAATP